MNTWRNYFRPFALVLGTAWLVASTGCYNWAVAPEGTAVAAQQPKNLRLTLTDGRIMDLFEARMVGDSLLVGLTTARGRATVPVALVRTVEVSHMDTGKTAGVTIVVLGVIVAALAAFADFHTNPFNGGSPAGY